MKLASGASHRRSEGLVSTRYQQDLDGQDHSFLPFFFLWEGFIVFIPKMGVHVVFQLIEIG